MSTVHAKFEAHVRRYRDQADKLKLALKKTNLIRNPERFDALFRHAPALVQCDCPAESGEESYEWTYEVCDLALTVSGLRHPMPRGASFGTGLLTCKVTEFFSPARRNGVAGIMPVKSVELNFVIEGKLEANNETHPLVACWHVDTHGEEAADGEPTRQDNHALHPLFHYQFGGRKFREAAPIVRGVLMLDAPRLPIPPLDLNLAIDFVVTNYAGANWKALRRDTQYVHPVQASMRRIWGPYYASLANHFTNPKQIPSAVRYLPDLL